MKLRELRESVVAGAGAVATLLVAVTDTFGALPEGPSTILAGALAVATGVVTYFSRKDVSDIVDRF